MNNNILEEIKEKIEVVMKSDTQKNSNEILILMLAESLILDQGDEI